MPLTLMVRAPDRCAAAAAAGGSGSIEVGLVLDAIGAGAEVPLQDWPTVAADAQPHAHHPPDQRDTSDAAVQRDPLGQVVRTISARAHLPQNGRDVDHVLAPLDRA